MNELEILIQRMLDGTLHPTERETLSTLLKGNPEAQAYYAQQCQLHAELLMNEDIRQSLPVPPPIDEALEDSLTAAGNSSDRKTYWMPFISMVTASVVITLGVVIGYQKMARPDTIVSEVVVAPQVQSYTPQEVYELTEFSEPGSQQRPPTPFVNVGADQRKSKVSFNQDVRPILSENCYACHGPDAESREADLRLDLEEWVFREREEGPPAIIPGDPDNSPVYQRITNPLKSEIMPPPDSHRSLTEAQKQLIGQWISEGANWEGHWAFMQPSKPKVPNVPWGNNEIDKFTYTAMVDQGMTPNKEADRATLARRLSLDLTGLPPTPELVKSFENDTSANAYENLVDKLLASTAYGEHQARFWLDAARYADTHGLHLDNYREIWPYRDWVIKSFNENKPFDEFTVEQIAGDLLPEATLEQRLATGFNRCNPTTSEGGAIDAEYRAIYAKDRVETTATVFMGLTMGCAACHDHKFDPISMTDFYEFSAFFNNLDGPVMDGNAYDTRPIVVIPKPEQVEDWKAVQDERASINQALSAVKKKHQNDFEAWKVMEDITYEPNSLANYVNLEIRIDGESDEEESSVADGAVTANMGEQLDLASAGFDFDPDQPFTISCSLRLPAEGPDKLDRVSVIEQFDGDRGWRLSVANSDITFPNRYQITFELIHSLRDNNLIAVTAKSERVNPREYSTPTINVSYDGSRTVAGLTISSGSRQPYDFRKVIDNLSGPVKTEAPLQLGLYPNGLVPEEQASTNYKTGFYDQGGDSTKAGQLKNIKFYDRQIYPFEVGIPSKKRLVEALMIPEDRRRGRDASTVESYFFENLVPEYRELKYKEAVNDIAYNHIYDQATISLVMAEKKTAPSAHILSRGEYDKPGEEVYADIPESLGGLPQGAPKNRLGLAQWLIDENNPLTARVTVNRYWQNLFGTGIVATSEDFGLMGENPTHPELLDWLAIHFQENDWDVKGLIKYIVMSATYRQDSKIDPAELAIDRNNRYLARGPRYRLDGEVLRDKALYVSGSLKADIGGPPVKPYQPSGIWNAVAYSDSNTAHFSQDHGDALYRRSLYTFWKRTAPPPNMVVFDVPSRENCNVRRERTNTPLQALTLMNDPQYVEAARKLAERVMIAGKASVEDRIDTMYTYAFGDEPIEAHHDVLRRSYDKFHSTFKEKPQDAENLVQVGDSHPQQGLNTVELASLTMVANQIMNLDSFINKY